LNGGNLAYLYANADDFKIGNGTPGKALIFFANPTGGTPGGNTAIGVERMRITEGGLSVSGSIAVPYIADANNHTILSTEYIIYNGGTGTPTWTLPLVTGCTGRIYRLINQGTGAITLSQSVTTGHSVTTNILPAGGNFEIISDGSSWIKIN
jgi:hypothetical protein